MNRFVRALCIVIGVSFNVPVVTAATLKPERLTCESIVNPLGIDTTNPRLGWWLTSADRNQKQAAYEIIVGDVLADVQNRKASVWSTSKVPSSQSIQIEFKGNILKPRTRYYWRVRVYDQNNVPSSWSDVAWFETGMMDDKNWTSKWIDDGKQQPTRDEDYYKEDPMPLFRKNFNATKSIQSARLYVSGLG
jgi:alpha-L-rhamnosidase